METLRIERYINGLAEPGATTNAAPQAETAGKTCLSIFPTAISKCIGICLAVITIIGMASSYAVAHHYTEEDLYNGPLFETHAHIVSYRSESGRLQYNVDAREGTSSVTTADFYLENRERNGITCTVGFHAISMDDMEMALNQHAERLLSEYPGKFILFAEIFRDNPIEWFNAASIEPMLDSGIYSGFGEIQFANEPLSDDDTETPRVLPNNSSFLAIYESLGDRGLFVMAHPAALDGLDEAILSDTRVTWILHGPQVHNGWDPDTLDDLRSILDTHDNVYYTLDFAESLEELLDITKGRRGASRESSDEFVDSMEDPDYFSARLSEMVYYWKPIIEDYPSRFMWGTDMASLQWMWEDPDVLDLMVEFSRAFIATLDSTAAENYAYGNAVRLFGGCDGEAETIEFESNTIEVDEAVGDAVISVVRTGMTTYSVSVDYNIGDGSATGGGDDYTGSSGTLTFGPGESTAEIRIAVNDDHDAEGPETVMLSLLNPTRGMVLGTKHTATLSILNNDVAFRFTSNALTVMEGLAVAEITVERFGETPHPVSVVYATSDGTGGSIAFAGSDYEGVTGTLSFAPGELNFKRFLVTIYDDPYPEPHRTFNVKLTSAYNPDGAANIVAPEAVAVTIQNDDVAFRFRDAAYSVSEADGLAIIGVDRLGALPPGVEVSVDYATIISGTSAVAGIDYIVTSGTLRFSPAETEKEFLVEIFGDGIDDGDKIINLQLSNPQKPTEDGHAGLATPDRAVVFIRDIDGSTPATSF